jgi:hypothetical protein
MRPVTFLNPALIRFSFAWLRRKVRASEAMFILLAVGVGGVSDPAAHTVRTAAVEPAQ